MSLYRFHKGFTLIELMIVITIIAVLIAILLPNVSRSRQRAIVTSCEHNERNLAAAIEIYNAQYKRYPASISVLYPNYMKRTTCPTNVTDYGYVTDSEGKQFTVFCQGTHYLGIPEVPQGYPQYTPNLGTRTEPLENTASN